MDNSSESTIKQAPEYPIPLPPDQRGVATILWRILTAAEATPLAPPNVPEKFAAMPIHLRLHACLRLFLLDIEYALSPGGQLRGLLKLACRISVAMACLTLCAVGVLTGVMLVLAAVLVISRQLVEILWNLLAVVLLLITLLAVAGALMMVTGLLIRHGRDPRKR